MSRFVLLTTLLLFASTTANAQEAPEQDVPDNDLSSRYMYTPSAQMLKQGQGHISQKQLVFTKFSYGIADNLTLHVGTALPFFFMDGGSALFGFKAGEEVLPNVHLAVNVEGLFIKAGNATGVIVNPSVTGTLGNEEHHASLSVGWGLGTGPNIFTGGPVATLSGFTKISDHFGIVTEHWFALLNSSYSGTSTKSAHGLAGRINLHPLHMDVGAILLRSDHIAPIPIPWLDITYAF